MTAHMPQRSCVRQHVVNNREAPLLTAGYVRSCAKQKLGLNTGTSTDIVGMSMQNAHCCENVV